MAIFESYLTNYQRVLGESIFVLGAPSGNPSLDLPKFEGRIRQNSYKSQIVLYDGKGKAIIDFDDPIGSSI